MGAHELSYDDLAISAISVEDQMCISSKYSVKVWLKNKSNHTLNLTNLPLKYEFNGNTISVLKTISNLAAGDSIDYIFSSKITAAPVGVTQVNVWFTLNYDINKSNDTIHKTVNVNNYPVIGIPVDTTSCSIYTVTLDAGSGYSSYLWSTGDTSSVLTLDVSMLGLGGTFVSVVVSQNGCSAKDSTLVRFVDCTGLEENMISKSVSVYPNPAKSVINIKMNEFAKVKYVEIRDLTGRIVFYSEKFQSKIDISGLMDGGYMLIINTEKGKVIKQIIKR